jgi:choline kinase
VAVDRKINAIFDLGDAMKVKTNGDRVVAIGKDLQDYDAIDTGLFVCPPEVFTYLEQAKRDGDCSLADGVRAMAADGKVRAIDIGDAWWQDIDTPEMLAQAEKVVRDLNEGRSTIRTGGPAVS